MCHVPRMLPRARTGSPNGPIALYTDPKTLDAAAASTFGMSKVPTKQSLLFRPAFKVTASGWRTVCTRAEPSQSRAVLLNWRNIPISPITQTQTIFTTFTKEQCYPTKNLILRTKGSITRSPLRSVRAGRVTGTDTVFTTHRSTAFEADRVRHAITREAALRFRLIQARHQRVERLSRTLQCKLFIQKQHRPATFPFNRDPDLWAALV